jgi:hypothetical protein
MSIYGTRTAVVPESYIQKNQKKTILSLCIRRSGLCACRRAAVIMLFLLCWYCLGNFDDIRKAIKEGTTSRRVLPWASMKDKGPHK